MDTAQKSYHFFNTDKPVIMGILNVTPDSFFDGSKHNSEKNWLDHAEKMISEGADIIDLGGFSTRPGCENISTTEELRRVIPAVESLMAHFPEITLSVDTFRAEVAKHSIESGAKIINDISGGLYDEAMIPYIGKNHITYILMHTSGTTLDTMHTCIIDEDICQVVKTFFEQQVNKLLEYGPQNIVLDPGIGFGKTIKANYELLKQFKTTQINNYPILIGISHKSLINKVLNLTPQDSLNGTTVLNTIALMNGADILRVHDVKEAVEAVKLTQFYKFNSYK